MPFISQLAAQHGFKGWKPALILLLAFLMPLSPVLAYVQEDAIRQERPLDGGLAAYYGARCQPQELNLAGRYFLGSFPGATTQKGGTKTQDACTTGRLDASEKTDGTLWFILGFATGPWGVLGAYLINPSTADVNLKGKSENFVSAYLECYRDEAKGIHTKWAWIGFGTVFALLFIAGMALLLWNKPT